MAKGRLAPMAEAAADAGIPGSNVMIRHSILCGAIAALVAAPAGAAELQYGFEAGVGTSDNITRIPANGESETIATAGLDLRLLREGSLVNADVNVDLSYFDYRDGTYDSEVTGTGEATVGFAFVPDRFVWVVQDSFGQSQLDPFAVQTPANRENINYFSTGPDLSLRLGSAGILTLYGRYSMTDYEDTGLDDERITGGLSFGRDLSARSSLSFNVSAERVEFDDPLLGSDYDRQSAFFRYENDGARTRIGIQAGVTELHDLGRTNTNPLFELDLERDLSQRSSLSLRAGVRSSDASTALRSGNAIGGGFPGIPGQVSTADPFETRNATLTWNFQGSRTGFLLSGGYEEDVYETLATLDRTREQYEASVWRQITPRLKATLRAAQQSNDFDSVVYDDEELVLGLALSWNVTGRLFIELNYDDIEHDSSNPLQEFDETRAFLRFAWRNTGGGSGAR
jgi:hypothetical protein